MKTFITILAATVFLAVAFAEPILHQENEVDRWLDENFPSSMAPNLPFSLNAQKTWTIEKEKIKVMKAETRYRVVTFNWNRETNAGGLEFTAETSKDSVRFLLDFAGHDESMIRRRHTRDSTVLANSAAVSDSIENE